MCCFPVCMQYACRQINDVIGARSTRPESSAEAARINPVPIIGPKIETKMKPNMLPLHAKTKPAKPPAVSTPKSKEPLSTVKPELFRCMYKKACAPKARPTTHEPKDCEEETAGQASNTTAEQASNTSEETTGDDEHAEETTVVNEPVEETIWAKMGVLQPPTWVGPPPKAWWPAKPPPPKKTTIEVAGVGLIYAIHV